MSSLVPFSQENHEHPEHESMKGTHRLTIGLGHTHLAKGKNSEDKTVWLVEPSWSLKYDFWLANKWGLGLQADMVNQRFVVEDKDGQELERDKPLALIPVVLFKPFKHFAFLGGCGVELEHEQNLGLTRLGIEYGKELSKGWEAGVGLVWDNKWNHYNSWALEFVFSKNFFRHK